MKYKDTFTKKELILIDDMIDTTINDTNDSINFTDLTRKINMHNSYVKAYNLLMGEAWEMLNDDQQEFLDERLKRLKL